MSDDIYEQSAQQALRVAQSVGRATEGGLAEEAGLKARTIQDGEMDASWRNKRGPSLGIAGDDGGTQARQMMENRSAVESRRKIIETGELSMDDLLDLGMGDGGEAAREAVALKRKMGVIAQHTVHNGARQMVNDAYMNPNEATMMMEQEAYHPPQQMEGWGVVKQAARLKTGKQIAVFVVEDALSGMNTGKKYRLAEVAEKVARVVNATNNPNDPRVDMINKAYDQHVKLMRERGEANRVGNRKRVAMIESKLQEVNTRLGIA